MESITQHETLNDGYRSGGGSYTIALGVRYPDPEDSEYEHALVWKFEPTFAVDAQTPTLESRGFIHKKYWNDIRDDIDYTLYSTDDGSNIIESYGWFDCVSVENVPRQVQDEMKALFGSELSHNTFNNPVLDAGDGEVPTVDVPDDAEAFVAEIELTIDGRATEEISEDDPRVTPDDFTSHVKDGETGEILSTSHMVSHSCMWWIEPVRNDDGKPYLRINKCFHKEWDDRMVGSFECKYENETLVEAYQTPEDAPAFDTLPDDVIKSLAEWLGEPIVKRSLERVGGEMPTWVYECFDCEMAFEATPRDYCIECGNDALITYQSIEQYNDTKENESDEAKKVKDWLVNAEVTVSSDE